MWARQGLDLESELVPYLAAAERSLPHLVEQVRGLADGAEADFLEVFGVNAAEELDRESEPDRCSTFTAAGEGVTLLAHAEMWYQGDARNAALVIERPANGPAVASPTVVCCLPAVGVNAFGAAQGIDSLSARTDRPGIPRVLVSRHALEARNRSDAVARAGLEGRAGGYAHTYAFRGGDRVVLETTAHAVAVADRPGHANHYLDPVLAEEGHRPDRGSLSRQARLDELLASRPPRSPDEAMELLRDHVGDPQAICHHPETDDPEVSTVVFAFVSELESGRLWVSAGHPCQAPFEEVDLADVV
jgi:isopenicillin-N N-acyltransferase like protein